VTRSRGVSRWLRCALLAALACSIAADAAAYCRTRTCQLKKNVYCPQDPVSGCFTEGIEVFWGDACISYALQRDGSQAQNISVEQVAPLVDEAFRAWSDVACPGGGSPPLTALSQGSIACDAAEFNCESPEDNTNIILFRDNFVDTEFFRAGVIALTTITASTRTGQIFDADIEINSRDEDFVFGPTPEGSRARDLHGVLTHEVGHLLGLSHPNTRGALMYTSYQGTVLPQADDIAGICASRGAARDPECTVTELAPDAGCVGAKVDCVDESSTRVIERSPDCSCRVGEPASPARHGWLGALALAGWLWRRGARQA
jgi:MYXO-CTERM domain-containing protein